VFLCVCVLCVCMCVCVCGSGHKDGLFAIRKLEDAEMKDMLTGMST